MEFIRWSANNLNFYKLETFNRKKNEAQCTNCDCTELNNIAIPYACKLLLQELMAMGISPRINEKNNIKKL